MKKRTVRLILDCMICDAMSPEFKKANDILSRIIKTNDRTDGLPPSHLGELIKAIKANDPKAAKAAYDKLAALIGKCEKRLQDELNEAKSELHKTSISALGEAQGELYRWKNWGVMLDKLAKIVNSVKTNPKNVSKLNVYVGLKPFKAFSELIMQIQKGVTAKEDISKQCDMLKKAVEAKMAKQAEGKKKAENELAKVKDRVAAFKELVKIRTKKVAEFAKEREDIQKLGQALPAESVSAASGKSSTASGNANAENGKANAESGKAHTDKYLSLFKKMLSQKGDFYNIRAELRGDKIYASVETTVKAYGDSFYSTEKISYDVDVRKGVTYFNARNPYIRRWSSYYIYYEFTGIKSAEITYFIEHD